MSAANNATVVLREQVIEDPASGLTIAFKALSKGHAELRLIGESLPHGNRVFTFDPAGNNEGRGSSRLGMAEVMQQIDNFFGVEIDDNRDTPRDTHIQPVQLR